MGDLEDATAFDICLEGLDKSDSAYRRGVITRSEFEGSTQRLLATYLENAGAGDDIDFMVEYAREPFIKWACDPIDGDREAVNRFDGFLRCVFHLPVARINLHDLLNQIEQRFDSNNPSGVESLITLCGSGYRTQPDIYIHFDLVRLTIDLAVRLGAVGALVAAVDPASYGWEQLGHPSHFDGRAQTLVFDTLGELAVRRDPVGILALDALVDLCRHLETTACASVRLPAFRLSPQHRASLLSSAESIDALMAHDPIGYLPYSAGRAPSTIKSVLWLANDASHVR